MKKKLTTVFFTTYILFYVFYEKIFARNEP